MIYIPDFWGTHTVEITLQQSNFKGKITVWNYGNCKGFRALENAKDRINREEMFDSNCKFKIEDEDDWFRCILKDENENELEVEDELDNLDDYIVKVEIIDFE